VNRILSLILNLHHLTISMLLEFIAVMITLLQMTCPHRHSFKVKEVKELTGKLNHIMFSAPWLKYLLGNIYSSMVAALQVNNSHLACTSQHFCNALHAIRNAPLMSVGNSQ
jgi:hypothetical protein